MEFIKGPLGSHKNYITYIVLPNCIDYFQLQKLNEEHNNLHASSKYGEVRHFLNAIESMNNILDYFFYENESYLSIDHLTTFKKQVCSRYPILKDVADIANAYKHCVRESKGNKNPELLWARDIQRPRMVVNIDLMSLNNPLKKEDIKVNTDYKFEWPIDSYEQTLVDAFKFWKSYGEPDGPDLSCV